MGYLLKPNVEIWWFLLVFVLPLVIKSLKNHLKKKNLVLISGFGKVLSIEKKDMINIGWRPNRWFGWRCSKYFVYKFTLYKRWITSHSMFSFCKRLPNGEFFFKMEEKGCWVFSGKISHFLEKINLDSVSSSRS